MEKTIEFKGDFYAKSPEEFKQIKIAALKAGYKGIEMSNGPREKSSGRGQFLTLEAPRYERKGKCGYCGSLIDICGIYAHGRKCECCGKTIYQKYEKGGLITFFFRDFEDGNKVDIFGDITLRIHSFETDKNILRFEMNIPRDGKYGKQKRSRVLEILKNNRSAYNIIEIGKKKVYTFYYPFNGMMNDLTRINTSEVRNRKGGHPSGPRNCSVVQILDGKEYSEHASFSGIFAELPMPTSFHIYRDWKIEKTMSTMCSRSGINLRPEYYSGRSAGDITSDHLFKLYNQIKDNKGENASKAFLKLIEGTYDLSATNLTRKFIKLERNNYEWSDSENTEKETNVELDGSSVNAFATIVSVMSGPYGRAFTNRLIVTGKQRES